MDERVCEIHGTIALPKKMPGSESFCGYNPPVIDWVALASLTLSVSAIQPVVDLKITKAQQDSISPRISIFPHTSTRAPAMTFV